MKLVINKNPKVLMVHMTRDEALRTIESLAHQLHSGDPNTKRYEKFTDCGYDFSIAVHGDDGMERLKAREAKA